MTIVTGSVPSTITGWTFSRASPVLARDIAGNIVPFTSGTAPITNRGLLVEPSAQNSLTRNLTLEHADWQKGNSTVTANTALAPDGTLTADTVVDTNTSGSHGVYENFTALPSAICCSSAFWKAKDFSWVWMYLTAGGSPVSAYFDLVNGVVGTTSGASGYMEPYANGFYRCSIVTTAVMAAINAGYYLASADNVNIFNTGGGQGNYLWMPQVESRNWPTSPIATVATAVTRAAAVATIATAVVPPGALIEFYTPPIMPTSQTGVVSWSDGSANNCILVEQVSGNIVVFVIIASVIVANLTVGPVFLGKRHKLALRLVAGSVAASLDGGAVLTSSAGLPVISSRSLGADPFVGAGPTEIAVFKELPVGPTDTVLRTLTS
jgi:hypothetical protein